MNDCQAVYEWMLEHADELQIDTDRIIITGGSSGGHLALCLAFRLKRFGYCKAPMPRGVIVQVPAIDDIDMTESIRYEITNPETGKAECWDTNCRDTGFRLWLGKNFGRSDLSPEATPNRATLEDVRGLPPVWIPCEAEFEPGRDSIYRLAGLMHQAGVFCELHVWGATNHGFCGGGDNDFARRWSAVASGAIRDAVTYDFRRPWLNDKNVGGKNNA